MQILFIHCPKTNDHYVPLGPLSFINIIPQGLFTMADYLDQNGITAKILHMGLRRYRWGESDPVRYVRENSPKVAALSLFWHHQSWDVINTAKILRENFPGLVIILGGLTAAYFADEILRDYPFIDGIITGDGEEPVLALMQLLTDKAPDPVRSGSSFANSGVFSEISPEKLMMIPNLKYTAENRIITSCCQSTTSGEILDSVREYRLDQLEDAQLYMEASTLPSFWVDKKDTTWMRSIFDRSAGVFFPVLGRGCQKRCPWCGRQKRSATVMRNPSKVTEAIIAALKSSYESLCFSFDPDPDDTSYFLSLFKTIRRETNLAKTGAYFESWGFPGETLIKSFKKTFPRGTIGITAECGDEALRLRHRGPRFTDEALYASVGLMEKNRVSFDVFFAAGLPGENEEMFKKTSRMIKHLENRCRMLDTVVLQSIEIEPGSPWFENPDKFGIITDRKTFADFVRAHGPGGESSFTSLGYVIPGYFGDKSKNRTVSSFEDAILDLRCRTKCFLDALVRPGLAESHRRTRNGFALLQAPKTQCYYKVMNLKLSL